MIIRAVLLFLIGMGVLAMFGKLRMPRLRNNPKRLTGHKCPHCGKYLIGKSTCDCRGARQRTSSSRRKG